MIPFLKWAGGKRWFIANHADQLPSKYKRYIEPFLGGGSVFFHLEPRKALLGDVNGQLVETYIAIREHWRAVVEALAEHQTNHGSKYYYRIRKYEPQVATEKAARFIYLNRTCFNGIYRVNCLGKFNVPKGTKDRVLFEFDDFQAISRLLKRAEIRRADFEELVDEAKRGDFLFADPPYTVSHSNNGFIKYNEKLFSWDDQVRLAKALARARDRGVMLIATNANQRSLREMYQKEGFSMRAVRRFSAVSADADGRNQFEELVVSANTDSNGQFAPIDRSGWSANH